MELRLSCTNASIWSLYLCFIYIYIIYIYILWRWSSGLVSIINGQSIMFANILIHHRLNLYLFDISLHHYHHYADLLKALNIQKLTDISVEYVSKIKSVLSDMFHAIYGTVYFQQTISFVIIMRICILCLIIISKSEVWIISHCVGLGHETMVSTACLMHPSLYWDEP